MVQTTVSGLLLDAFFFLLLKRCLANKIISTSLKQLISFAVQETVAITRIALKIIENLYPEMDERDRSKKITSSTSLKCTAYNLRQSFSSLLWSCSYK